MTFVILAIGLAVKPFFSHNTSPVEGLNNIAAAAWILGARKSPRSSVRGIRLTDSGNETGTNADESTGTSFGVNVNPPKLIMNPVAENSARISTNDPGEDPCIHAIKDAL